MEQLTKNQAVATSQEAVQNQNEPQLRDENAHNDKSVHGVLNPTYQAGLRRDAVQPDIEAERKKRDEIEAGKSYCSRRFGGATCDDKSAQIYARFDKNEIGRAVQQECRDRARMPSSARKNKSGFAVGLGCDVRFASPPATFGAVFFKRGASTCVMSLSLHDALPISVQPDIEAERKKRDEIEAGKSYCSRRFGGATCDDKSAQIYARFDKN